MTTHSTASLHSSPQTVEELEDLLSQPTEGVLEALRKTPGDILVLGASGKMGPTLARMARRALDELGRPEAVIAVSRFSSEDARRALEHVGIRTIRCDLANAEEVARLPDAPNVIHLTGQKFGTSGASGETWMVNVVAPALAALRYAKSRIVVLSTGNVYPLVPASGYGSRESDVLAPVGEYAWSCLARERVIERAALRNTRTALVRLNYANDLRYGVITDLAIRVQRGDPVPLDTPCVNVIWQGDANARVLQCLPLAATPPFVLNVTGAEKLYVRALATSLGALLQREPVFAGEESADALLSDASRATELFGLPAVSWQTLVTWTAEWVNRGMPLLGKPTHFEARDGVY